MLYSMTWNMIWFYRNSEMGRCSSIYLSIQVPGLYWNVWKCMAMRVSWEDRLALPYRKLLASFRNQAVYVGYLRDCNVHPVIHSGPPCCARRHESAEFMGMFQTDIYDILVLFGLSASRHYRIIWCYHPTPSYNILVVQHTFLGRILLGCIGLPP